MATEHTMQHDSHSFMSSDARQQMLRHQPKTGLWMVVATLLYALIFVLVLIFKPGDEQQFKAFSNVAQLIPPLFAAACSLNYAVRLQQNSFRRAGWLVIGTGCFFWGMGQGIFTVYDLRAITSFPSWADFFFVLAYPFFVAGVSLLFGSIRVTGRTRLLVDSAIAASSLGVISWHFLVGELWNQAQVSTGAKILTAFYPLGDVVILFSALVLLLGSAGEKQLRLPHTLLAGGVALVALTDSVWNYYTLKGIYQTGSWIDPGWAFGFLLISYAPMITSWQGEAKKEAPTTETATPGAFPDSTSREAKETVYASTTLTRILMPYIAAIVAWSIVVSSDYRQDSFVSTATFISGFWLLFLAVVRQIVTLFENQHLTLELRSFNTNLEGIVALRTQQLSSLYELTKAVNNTLEADETFTNALDHTLQALRADAVVVRLLEETPAPLEDDATDPPFRWQRGLDEHPGAVDFLGNLPIDNTVQVIALPDGMGSDVGANYLVAPLIWRDQLQGSIGVVRWKSAFSSGDAEMLENIGIEVAAAHRNAQVHAIAVENADRDAVTGLYNHRAIHGRLDVELERAQRMNRHMSIIMMDLNNFKLFNDNYGHPVGDQVLKNVAAALHSASRRFDILGRYGGDEFIAILPETDLPLAMVVAQRWRDRMMLEGFDSVGDERVIPVTLSFGIATYPDDSDSRHELISIADANLYSAKISERGIVSSGDIQRQHRQVRAESSFDVLDALVTAVDNKDLYTRRHSEDVTEFALWIVEELQLSEETMRTVRLAGLLHDVGKIGVPEAILRKPGRLTNDEFEVMKQHPQFGAHIVAGVPDMQKIVDGVRYHHERWDGKGYPEGLAGAAIPFLGRLLAVADAYSAMTTDRPYRKSLPWEDSLKEIETNIGTQFDPAMAAAFLRSVHKRRPATDARRGPHLRLVENGGTVKDEEEE